MTADHPVRRLLARCCSPDTMARVVDPTLADLRWESGRLTCSGCLTLLKALMVHALRSTPGALSRTWSDDDHAIPRVTAIALAGAAIGAVVLGAPTFTQTMPNRDASVIGLAVLLAPAGLMLTLPAALLLAIPLAFRRQDPSARLARRTIALSVCAVAATFVLMLWILPESNQAFRLLSSGRPDLARGSSEQGLAAMRERIETTKLRYRGEVAARRLEFDYQLRFVLPCLPLPVGMLALAIARSDRGRRRPWRMGLTALAGYIFLYWPVSFAASTLVRSSSLPPFVFAWLPFLLLAIVATTLLRRAAPQPA